jgi:hypothetical protein
LSPTSDLFSKKELFQKGEGKGGWHRSLQSWTWEVPVSGRTGMRQRDNPFLPAGIVEVLDPKGLRKGMNRRDTWKDSLTQEGNDKTHDQKAGDQLAKFYFSQQVLYKRGRDLNIKNTLT